MNDAERWRIEWHDRRPGATSRCFALGRPRSLAAAIAWITLSVALGCSLQSREAPSAVGQERRAPRGEERADEAARRAEQRAQREAAEGRRAAEEAAREQVIIEGISKLRAEIAAEGPDRGASAVELAKLVADAAGTDAAKEGRLAIDELAIEAASHLEKAITAAPSMALLDAMLGLPSAPRIDAAVLRACPRVRPTVSEADLADFIGACLDRADGDAKRLRWAGSAQDILKYKRAMEARLSAEAAARQEQAKIARYIAAATFAAGSCSFNDCLKNGWTIPSPDGDIDVRCDFQDCLKSGWTARFPDGREARTGCSFQSCMKDGWETTHPDGETSRTRCSFQDCLKNGWETELPGGSSARTSCSFQDCLNDGWETELPGGGHQQCRCNFQKCAEHGASCG